jgi:hypothetical protein
LNTAVARRAGRPGPAVLLIERPIKLEFIMNSRTLTLTIPSAILARADEVIE